MATATAAAGRACGSRQIEAVMTAQRAFMDTYGEAIEHMLSMLVLMVPLQDEEGDTAGYYTQAGYSVTDLFHLYRTVLLRRPESLPLASAGGPGRAALSRRAPRRGGQIAYSATAFALRALRSVQVLIEMRAQRVGGMRHALRTCLRVEVVKLVLKLALRTYTPFAFYVDDEALEEADSKTRGATKEADAAPALAKEPASDKPAPGLPGDAPAFVGTRSGRCMPAMGPSVLQPLCVKDASPLSVAATASDVVFHCRPLVHLVALLRFGRQSWAAWFAALLLDQISIRLLSRAAKPRSGTRAAAFELAEVRRRKNMVWWAFARSPCFERLLRTPCVALDKSVLSRIPVVNQLQIMPLVLALQPFYFSTSAT